MNNKWTNRSIATYINNTGIKFWEMKERYKRWSNLHQALGNRPNLAFINGSVLSVGEKVILFTDHTTIFPKDWTEILSSFSLTCIQEFSFSNSL